jgi:cellulose synthase/poly-beta-1,6-N-acetylglucosamine synthase-like glycosyltransferase
MVYKDIVPQKVAVIIFARNESSVIKKTVENTMRSLRPTDSLLVIADDCSDDTAMAARDAGAKVIVREPGNTRGKGAALSWFMTNHKIELETFDWVVILDADSLVPADFIEKLVTNLPPGIEAAQCFLSPIGFEGSPLTTLIALSEIVEQSVFDRIRSRLGLSVRLKGTGMVFKPQLLFKLCSRIGTDVEDIALSLLIAEQRIIIRPLEAVTVFDPKPTESAAASRQRARWFRGQWRACWNYRVIVLKLLARGPTGWVFLGSLFLKPRWLKLIILIIVGLVFLSHPVVSLALFFLVGLELLLILVGLLKLPNRKLFLRSLLYLPGFVWMWIRGIFLSLKHRPWQRVRENGREYSKK